MADPEQKPELTLMALGHPLLDISCPVGMSYLEKYKIERGSCNLAEKHQLPIFEELSQDRNVEFVPGGAAMNAVRVATWMNNAPKVAYFVGSLGDDEFGCILERALRRGGVTPLFEYQEEKPTGTCACLIVDQERSLLAHLGAAVDLSLAHLHSKAVQDAIEATDVFYCEGFVHNTVSSPQNIIEIGRHSLERDKILAFNLSAPYLCHIFKDRWEKVMPFIDIIFGSRIDALAYSDAWDWGTTDLGVVMGKLCELYKENPKRPRLVVITGGSEVTYVAYRGNISTYPTIRVPPEEIVDTNGAGDAFVGGFLSQYLKHKRIDQCVNAGHAAAAEVIRNNGCTFGEHPPAVS
jgi:adenosine kinase